MKRTVPTAGQHELKLGEVVTTIPTIDSNVGTVEYKNLSFIVQKDTEIDSLRGQMRNEDHLLLEGRTSQNPRRNVD